MAHSSKSAAFLIESRIADAIAGDIKALYELGIAYSTGSGGIDVDLVEAHKWFNLAALNGMDLAQECRADIAEDMTAREIAEAQRQARAWLADMAPAGRRAAA
ncbi:MAG: SEL1-like repeat protein [Sphingomonas sp.]